MAGYERYIHYPDGYNEQLERRWPVILSLHGAGERNVALEILQNHHYYRPVYELTSTQYPALVVVPQCPPRQYWRPERINMLLDDLLATERIDADRVYLTGFSMGGYGTWMTAGAYPERYAAIAPVCGGGNPADAKRLAPVPTWAFHGALDPVVPVEETLQMVEAVRRAGGDPKVTIYPEGDHGVWDETFANPDLYQWFFQHTLRERRSKAA